MPECFSGTVSHLSEKGYGTVKDPNGKTYFVRGVWPGDEGVFQRVDDDEIYGSAQLLQLLKPSSERQRVDCEHWGLAEQQCFGCPWMLATYEAQLQRKEHRLRYALERLHIPTDALRSIWPAPSPFHYRSRAQFKTDGTQLGYAGLHGQSIAPIASCSVLSPLLSQHLQTLLGRLPQEAWQPETPHIWNFIDLDEDSDLENFPLNRRRPFSQVHKQQNIRMRTWLADKLQDGTGRKALELFAGSGNFTDILAAAGFEDIQAWEVGQAAVEELKAKNLPAVRAACLDLYQPRAREQIRAQAAASEVLVVNPPRAGLQRLAHIPQLMPRLQQIFYISCDPGTLAQDLKKLLRFGFRIDELQPLDQMPHTPHVEVLAALQRS